MRKMILLVAVVVMCLISSGCSQFAKIPVAQIGVKVAAQVAAIEYVKRHPEYKDSLLLALSALDGTVNPDELVTLGTLDTFVGGKLDSMDLTPESRELISAFVKDTIVESGNYVKTEDVWYARDTLKAADVIGAIREGVAAVSEIPNG